MPKLGVNIDHIATLRQARKETFPDPVSAAGVCELAGADTITIHLREDRRHIQDRDVYLLKQIVKTKLNLEMSIAPEIVNIAVDVKPDEVCIVPEKRTEVTTEGGLDVYSQKDKLKEVIARLKEKGIVVSLFIDPEEKQIEAAKIVGSDAVELHTGKYARSIKHRAESGESIELKKLKEAGKLAVELGLILNAGHGLDYENVVPVAKIPNMHTLNIGFAIIAKAVFVGLYQAVKEMKELIL
ncbi:MAG: pyridoxine 5'-phosphate synthase [Elusimicrobiota bacterium]|nr:pyridoxine 5'-phosphate synthase [Elusimicrobiota bacterium]